MSSVIKVWDEINNQWINIPSLAGDPGIYIGTQVPTNPAKKIWIDPSGTANAISTEDVKYKIYNSVEDLLGPNTSGSATIAGAWGALGSSEILIAQAGDFITGDGGVPSTYGVVEMLKRVGGRGYVNFYGKEFAHEDYRMYLNSSNNPSGEWVMENHFRRAGSFTGTAVAYTLPSSGTYVILTTHATGATSVGLWVYVTSGNTPLNIAGGSNITLTGSGTTLTAKSGGATVSLYYMRIY